MRRDEESGEDKRETASEKEANVAPGDGIRFDSTIVGRSKCDTVASLSSSPL